MTVARLAGVSRQTVSNVLNTPDRVLPDTALRVRQVIAETGYRPNIAARQLRTKRPEALGLRLQDMTDGINGVVLDRLLHALTKRAQADGYRLVLFTARDDQDEIHHYRELLDASIVEGFILTSTHHDDRRTQWLESERVPFVTFGRPWSAVTDVATSASHGWVDVDGAAGTREATRHLITLGHRNIGFIGWPTGSGIGDERQVGWRNEMIRLGIPTDRINQLVAATEDSVAQGADSAAELLSRLGPAPTAFVCASDSLALGALQLTRQRGSCAVVGFDDTPVATAVGLSSIAQPLVEVAHHAMSILHRQLPPADSSATASELHALLVPNLVVRDSSLPNPGTSE